jgi:hypothetical protein
MGLTTRGTARHALRRPALALLATACFVLPAACTSGLDHAVVAGHTLQITERDFHISVPRSIPSGDVLLHVRNAGPDWHELIIVHRDMRLPLRADGITVDEEALGSSIVGALEPQEVGAGDLRVNLTPGHYQFFCNMAGHFMAGMYRNVVVR